MNYKIFLNSMISIVFVLIGYLPVNANTCVDFLDKNSIAWSQISSFSHKYYVYSFMNTRMTPEIGKDKNSHIKWLLKLGFQFEDGNLEKATPPSLDALTKNYDFLIKKQIKKYNQTHPVHEHIHNNSIIHIGFEFLNRANQSITLRFGAPIPEGYTFSGRLTPGQKLYRSLNQGLFPLSLGGLSFHDFAHLTGYLEHPEYMAAYRRVAQHITEKFNGLIAKTQPGLYARVHYFNESLVLASQEKVEKNISFFAIPKVEDIPDDTSHIFSKILSEIKKLSHDELISMADNFLRIIPDIILEVGGATRDTNNSTNFNYHVINFLKNDMHEDLLHFSRVVDSKKTKSDPLINGEVGLRKRLENKLAKLQSGILVLSQTSPRQWAEYIIQENYSDSPVALYFRIISINDYNVEQFGTQNFRRVQHSPEGW